MLAADLKFIICDEPVSALDVSVRSQILNLLIKLKKDFGLTMLFVSHDLSVVEYICDRIIVMYPGQGYGDRQKRRSLQETIAPIYKRRCSGHTRLIRR